jgi:hypothetical protein
MSLKALLDLILFNEPLTRGLGDAEARMLIEWLVERTETHYAGEPCKKRVREATLQRCRRARGIARFVALWCEEDAHGAALQLAATERFGWPLPIQSMDACDLMHDILTWESQQRV